MRPLRPRLTAGLCGVLGSSAAIAFLPAPFTPVTGFFGTNLLAIAFDGTARFEAAFFAGFRRVVFFEIFVVEVFLEVFLPELRTDLFPEGFFAVDFLLLFLFAAMHAV
jgi:hypothetical protein